MKNRWRALVVVIAAGLLFGVTWAGKAPINTSRGVAIEGYDPVAYFDGKPMPGDKGITYEWRGAVWRFHDEANRDLFAADPERYAPQYGGYCAYAVSQGYTAGIDPLAWEIRDDKLYLNYSKKIQDKWLRDVDRYIAAADENWPGVLK